jgi:hypothetical protein
VEQAVKQSDYARKFEAAVAEMDAAGIWRSNSLPPYLKLGRKLGFELPPPYYQPFASVAVVFGLYFGTIWGILMSVVMWRPQAMPVALQIITATLAGFSFGLAMALWYRHVHKKHGLSQWQDL